MSSNVPSSDEWVEYCFVHGYRDFGRFYEEEKWSAEELAEAEARDERFESISEVTIGEYMARLFESPWILIERYTPDQIAYGVRFICNDGSDYFGSMFRNVDRCHEYLIRCYQGVGIVYRAVFDQLCSRDDRHHDAPSQIDLGVRGIWDMQIEIPVYSPRRYPIIAEHAFHTLEQVLHESRAPVCKESAIVGLSYSCRYGDGPGKRIIEKFLERDDLSASVRDMAEIARDGQLQG